MFICGNQKEIQGQYGGDLTYDKYLLVAVGKSLHFVEQSRILNEFCILLIIIIGILNASFQHIG